MRYSVRDTLYRQACGSRATPVISGVTMATVMTSYRDRTCSRVEGGKRWAYGISVRWRPILLLLFCLWAMGTAHAQEETPFEPRSGDAWIDRHLRDMNDYAARYPQSFVDEVSRYYSVPREYVEALLQQPAWKPGDVFMACALGQVLAQPCRNVVREWSRDHAEGWRGVGTRMQSKPGQPITRELRQDIRETYARWARPLAD